MRRRPETRRQAVAGGWGKGFVLAVSKRWSEPERAYREWHRNRASNDFGLGAVHAKRLGASVHMPRIGCGLAGGRIEPIIVETLLKQEVATTVYDFD